MGSDALCLVRLCSSPDFDTPSERFGYPFGLIIYYGWNVVGTVILLNILIALYNDSFSRIEEEATDYHMAFFAGKCISMIRGPDLFYYPPPLNLVEFFIAPLDWLLSKQAYASLNRGIMSILFALPLAGLAVFESQMNVKHSRRMRILLGKDHTDNDGEEDDESAQNPECEDDDEGKICKREFADLVKDFPDTAISSSGAIQAQLSDMQKQIAKLESLLKAQSRPNGEQ